MSFSGYRFNDKHIEGKDKCEVCLKFFGFVNCPFVNSKGKWLCAECSDISQ